MEGCKKGDVPVAVDEAGGKVADAGAVARQAEAGRDLDVEQGGGLAVGGLEVAEVQDAGEDVAEGGVYDGRGPVEERGRVAEKAAQEGEPGVAGME